MGNKSPALSVKKPLCTGDLLPVCKIFTERPKSLYDNVNKANIINDERLRIQMAVIREMIERNHINLQKINNKHQLADVLSEKGASNTLLTDVLKEGKMGRFKF